MTMIIRVDRAHTYFWAINNPQYDENVWFRFWHDHPPILHYDDDGDHWSLDQILDFTLIGVTLVSDHHDGYFFQEKITALEQISDCEQEEMVSDKNE